MDALTQVLRTLRITTTLFAIADLTDPWGVAFPAGRGAYFHTVDGGEAWLHVDSRAPARIASGDTVLLAHGTSHHLTSSPDAAVQAVFDHATWTSSSFAPAVGAAATPVALGEAGSAAPRTRLVCGAVEVRDQDTHPLLTLLPTVLRVGRDDRYARDLERTVRMIHRETHAPGPGTEELLARLGDVLLIQLLRVWIDTHASSYPGATERGQGTWVTALRDPRLASAITAMHSRPGEPWTVDALAAAAHLSRSRFAECFTAAVGQAPLAYLTEWRLNLALSLLRDGRSLRATATAVGYASEPAFSRAFTRHHGRPPSSVARAAR